MPAERARNSQGTRRGAEQPAMRELEFTMSSKRQLSCAECRRLKRRCDRQWPCKSCISRGCASICPDGTLTQGVGGRFILSGSEQLHKKIGEMGDRIRELEDALGDLWNLRNGDAGEHRLLRKDLLRIKLPPDVQSAELSASNLHGTDSAQRTTEIRPATEAPAIDRVTERLGTLKLLGSEGKMAYMGRTAKIEYLLPDNTNPITSDMPDPTRLPSEIVDIAQSFFISMPEDSPIDFSVLLTYLPERERGLQLCHYYFDRCGWFYQPMEKHEFIADVFNGIYSIPQDSSGTDGPSNGPNPNNSYGNGTVKRDPSVTDFPRTYGAIDLALLFMVFSGGANVDTALPALNEEVKDYHILAKAAMCLERPWDSSSLRFVQTLHLMIYNTIIWEQDLAGLEYIWGLMGLATKMTLTLGLHRDSAGWEGLGPKELNRRRRVFWDIHAMESWQTLGYGRPPALHSSYVDCKMPQTDETRDSEGNLVSQAYVSQLFRFVEECISMIVEHAFNVKTPPANSYAAVTELDKKVENFKVYEVFRNPGDDSMGWEAQSRLLLCAKHYARLYIHRGHFVRALDMRPDSPVESQFGASVMVTLRSATSLLQEARAIYDANPEVLGRFGLLSTYVLKVAVPMSVLCERSPGSPLVRHALEQLHAAREFLLSSQVHHPRTAHMIATLTKLQQNAYAAIASVGPGPTSHVGHASSSPEVQESEEASAYAGTSRIVHVASSQKIRSRQNTDSPKDRSNDALFNQGSSNLHPMSSVRDPVSATSTAAYTPSPPSLPGAYLYSSQGQTHPQNHHTSQAYVQHQHNQIPHQQTQVYGQPYTSQAQYAPQPDTYRGQPMSYVMDTSNGQNMQPAQYSGNSIPYDTVNYETSPSGQMMDAAMRDYDLSWINRFEPSANGYRR